jgi:hypothetical protein
LETFKIFAVNEIEAEILSLYDKGEKIADIAAALTILENPVHRTC